MIKLFLANDSKQSLGGGWSFLRNLKKGLIKYEDVEITETIEDCNIYLISGSTIILKENAEQAKALNKKIILRVDNIPKDSRNRGTGWSRLRKYAVMADKIIFQSQWARALLKDFIGDGEVIYNGADTDIFNNKDKNIIPNLWLYSRYNRDESKNWTQVYYHFIEEWLKDKTLKLRIIGNFSDEMVQYHFDFPEEMRDSISYGGIMETPEQIAKELKRAEVFYAPYLYDACSNSVLEALACRCRIMTNETGAMRELRELKNYSLSRMAEEYYQLLQRSTRTIF